jgi:hypothetical protein
LKERDRARFGDAWLPRLELLTVGLLMDTSLNMTVSSMSELNKSSMSGLSLIWEALRALPVREGLPQEEDMMIGCVVFACVGAFASLSCEEALALGGLRKSRG